MFVSDQGRVVMNVFWLCLVPESSISSGFKVGFQVICCFLAYESVVIVVFALRDWRLAREWSKIFFEKL
jgi:hypothetical protein